MNGPRVLVADPDEDESAALTAVLRLRGYDARGLRTASGLLAALAAEPWPRAVVLDLGLPDVDGLALIRRLRRLYPALAVVVRTGQTGRAVRQAALDAGAAAYLLKPGEPGELDLLLGDLAGADQDGA